MHYFSMQAIAGKAIVVSLAELNFLETVLSAALTSLLYHTILFFLPHNIGKT